MIGGCVVDLHATGRSLSELYRREVRRVLRERKTAWFFSKAQTAQQGRFGGKEACKCVRDMQLACRGLVPVRAGTEMKKATPAPL